MSEELKQAYELKKVFQQWVYLRKRKWSRENSPDQRNIICLLRTCKISGYTGIP